MGLKGVQERVHDPQSIDPSRKTTQRCMDLLGVRRAIHVGPILNGPVHLFCSKFKLAKKKKKGRDWAYGVYEQQFVRWAQFMDSILGLFSDYET